MELDDLKKEWQKSKSILIETNRVQTEKIKNMLKNSSADRLKFLKRYFLSNVILILFILAIFVFAFISKRMPDECFIASFVFSILFYLAYGIYSFYVYMRIRKMDIFGTSLIKLEETILYVRKTALKERLYLEVTLPLWSLPVLILFGIIKTENGLQAGLSDARYLLLVFFLVTILGGLLLYKVLLFSPLKKIEKSIAELKEFQAETEE